MIIHIFTFENIYFSQPLAFTIGLNIINNNKKLKLYIMIQDELNSLLRAQKQSASSIHSISKEILTIIEHALIGDQEGLEKLKIINTKDYDILNTFLKISSLLMKIFPIEHKILGTELIKTLKEIPQEPEFNENIITDADITVMKDYIRRYEKQHN